MASSKSHNISCTPFSGFKVYKLGMSYISKQAAFQNLWVGKGESGYLVVNIISCKFLLHEKIGLALKKYNSV